MVPFQVWLPGHLGTVGVGVGRRAASAPSSSSTPPVAAAAPRPNKPLSTDRRLAPDASALVNESKRLSSMTGCPLCSNEIARAATERLHPRAHRKIRLLSQLSCVRCFAAWHFNVPPKRRAPFPCGGRHPDCNSQNYKCANGFHTPWPLELPVRWFVPLTCIHPNRTIPMYTSKLSL